MRWLPSARVSIPLGEKRFDCAYSYLSPVAGSDGGNQGRDGGSGRDGSRRFCGEDCDTDQQSSTTPLL